MIELAVKTPDHIPPINDMLDVVEVDIPALLGLDLLDGHGLVIDNVTNRLWKRIVVSYDPLKFIDELSMGLRRMNDHIYVQVHVPNCTFYTTQQLKKLHRQFAHPSTTKLYTQLQRAGLEAVDADTM